METVFWKVNGACFTCAQPFFLKKSLKLSLLNVIWAETIYDSFCQILLVISNMKFNKLGELDFSHSKR